MARTISFEEKEVLLKELEKKLKQDGLYAKPFLTTTSLEPIKTVSAEQINKIREMMQGPVLEKAISKKRPAKR